MITYPVDVVNTRWAVLQLSTGQVLSRNKVWPVSGGGPIQGLDPDYVYLLHITATQPDYDSRLYTLQGAETVDAEANEIRIDWNAVKRPVEQINDAVLNEEGLQLAAQIEIQREAVLTRLMVGALLSFVVDNNAPPQKVKDLAHAYIAATVKIWQNRDRTDEMLAQVANDEEPDLDAGWAA